MKKKEFLSAGEAARALGVSVKTIQRWDKAGLLPVIRTATNQRRIPVATVHQLLKGQGKALRCAIYARVSSAKQEHEGNLTRQVERLQRVAQERSYELVALIQERPIDEVTVQEVLDRASVGRSTFYLHYRDKDDLLLSQLENFLETMSTALSIRKEESH